MKTKIHNFNLFKKGRKVSAFILFAALALLIFQLMMAVPVGAIPVITTTSLPQGQTGISYSTTLSASSVNGTPTWSITGGSLPPGLGFIPSTGTIYGTPTTTGTYVFAVIVTDVTGPSAPQSLSIIVTPPPLVIVTGGLPGGKEAQGYYAAISVNGGTAPYYWYISYGGLPQGLALDPTRGYIYGTVSRGSYGYFSITVTVTDSSIPQRITQESFTIYIEKGSYQASVTIGSGLQSASTRVLVNGSQLASLRAGESTSFNLDLGASAAVTVQSIIQNASDTGTRYKAAVESQTVTESSPSVIFDYATEYYLTVKAEPSGISQPAGSGWYRQGTVLNAAAANEIQGGSGIVYRISYWSLPSGGTSTGTGVNFSVNGPGTITAYYDTYYLLTINSIYSKTLGGGYYKTGSTVNWGVADNPVPMSGFLGFFQGKYRALNPDGSTTMDSPKTVTVTWEADYLWPAILIPLSCVLLILAGFGIYIAVRRSRRKPVVPVPVAIPYPTPMAALSPAAPYGSSAPALKAPHPIPQQITTVYMVQSPPEHKQLGAAAKEHLIENFRQLLDKYEEEIKLSLGSGIQQAPQVAAPDEKMIEPPAWAQIEAAMNTLGVAEQSKSAAVIFTGKKLLRTVVGKWRQSGDSGEIPSAENSKPEEDAKKHTVTWERDIFHEWELIGNAQKTGDITAREDTINPVYTFVTTISVKSKYGEGQPAEPPSPHFTNEMPEVEVPPDRLVHPGKLPSETVE
jgi:hypothetical protein